MADFPAIEPTTRRYDLGDFSMTRAAGFGGGEVRFLHGGFDPIGHDAELGFELISGAELGQIRDHYRGQDGGHVSFLLPAITWQGHPDGGILPEDGRWKYAIAPEETHRSGDLYDVTVALQYVGPEPRGVTAAVSDDVLTPGAFMRADASLTAGVASAGDANFANVSLLLQPSTEADGTNSFTDLSSNAFVITTVGSTEIDTAVTIFGQRTILNTAASSYIYAGSSSGGIAAFQFPGDFSIEFNVVIPALPATYHGLFDGLNIGGSGARGNTFLLAINSAGKVVVFHNGSFILTTTGSVATGSLQTIMLKRSGSTMSVILNGTADPVTATTSANFSTGAAVIGTLSDNAGGAGLGLAGNFTCRITKGVARATYTPSAPFQTS